MVNTHQAMKRKGKPVAENMVRLHKGDTVLDSKDGKKYRIGYFKAEGVIAVIPIVDPRAFDAIKESDSGKKKVSFSQIMRLKRLD